jgi:hypothetical protein
MESPRATRRNGKIVLEIDERTFLHDAVRTGTDSLAVTDPDKFLQFAANNILTLTHDVNELDQRNSWWIRLTQALAKAAAATDQGVRRIEAPAATCGCDPEEHDGG